MTTPTKQPILSQGILTPSCDITPTRETARDDNAYGFASLTHGKAVALDLITLKLLGRKSHIELLQHVFHAAEDATS